MRTEGIKVKVTIPIPIGKPDKNGIVYTEKAIEKAVGNLCENLPIIYRDNENNADGRVIGNITTTSLQHHILKIGILRIKFVT